MEILRSINTKSKQDGLPYILIGGHSVNAYGLSRQTGDIDLMILDTDAEPWKAIFIKAGYTVTQDNSAFIQFAPSSPAEWPIDLMLVAEDTLQQILSESSMQKLDGIEIPVPSVKHLLILKLHALKHGHAKRELKDLNDVVGLLERSPIKYDSPLFRDLCEQYGPDGICERIRSIMNGARQNG